MQPGPVIQQHIAYVTTRHFSSKHSVTGVFNIRIHFKDLSFCCNKLCLDKSVYSNFLTSRGVLPKGEVNLQGDLSVHLLIIKKQQQQQQKKTPTTTKDEIPKGAEIIKSDMQL